MVNYTNVYFARFNIKDLVEFTGMRRQTISLIYKNFDKFGQL